MSISVHVTPSETTERDYKLASAVAPHVSLDSIFLLSISAKMNVPHDTVVESMANGTLPASIKWRHVKELSQDALAVGVRLDFLVEFGKVDKIAKSNLELTCSYMLDYSLDSPPPDDHREELLDAFAKVNAVYNAWPYLRELVQNTFVRMSLPPPVVPVFRARPLPKEKQNDVNVQPAPAEGKTG
ncbi:MAG TPA: hypothetical protein VHO06_03705 [Polyangia bacterium]|nr:hypothetical protein [Polyangia bacterium]